MSDETATVRERLRQGYVELTPREKRLADALLEDYPNAGLASITVVARRAGVSTPTVARMVQKIGFKGFPQFHGALLQELQAQVSGPEERRAKWGADAPDSHMVNRLARAVIQNLEQTLAHLDTERFDQAARLAADVDRHLYVVGGRMTKALADYAFTHFQAVRPKVTYLTASSATWSHYLLDMAAGDVLLIFDVRRYETNLERLAELAREQGVEVILITDQWTSPVAKAARCVFNGWGEIPSAWDSNSSTLLLLEALIAAVQDHRWPETRARFEALDALFDRTGLFRKGP